MLSKRLNLICSGLVLCSAFLTTSAFSVAAATSDLTLNIDNQSYDGTYSGDLKDNKPSGEGTFSVSDAENGFTVSGTWKKGLLNGSVTTTYSDGSYTTSSYYSGKPYGRILKYNASQQLTGYDFYYQMRTISSLKEKSTDADYNVLLGTSFPDSPQKITGTVSAVFSTASNCFVILKDLQGHPYVLTYLNNSTNKFNQGIVPNLKNGDHITAYGYLQKQDSLSSLEKKLGHSLLVTEAPENLNSLSDSDLLDELDVLTADSTAVYNELSSNTLPFILIFAADVDGGSSFNIKNPSMDYADIITNPYLYSNLSYTLSGTVIKSVTKYDKEYVQLLVSENGTNNLFYVKYRFSDDDSTSLPATGDSITVDGLFNGNYKKVVPAENAIQIQNYSNNSTDSSDTDSESDEEDTNTDDFIDEDIADEYDDYDDIAYVILYPRLTTTSVTINK